MGLKNKKIVLPNKIDSKSGSGATTTHAFKALIGMMSSVDPAVLLRNREKFFKKHNPNYKKTYRPFKVKVLPNEVPLLKKYKQLVIKRNNILSGLRTRSSNVTLLKFINRLDTLKGSARQYTKNKQFNQKQMLKIGSTVDLLKEQLNHRLAYYISAMLSNNHKSTLSSKMGGTLSIGRKSYITDILYRIRPSSVESKYRYLFLVGKKNKLRIMHLINSLCRSSYDTFVPFNTKLNKHHSYFDALNLFKVKGNVTSVFLSLVQFNFLKNILSNLNNFDFLVHEKPITFSQFIYTFSVPFRRGYRRTKTGSFWKKSIPFFSVFIFFLKNTGSRYIPNSKLPRLLTKKNVLDYYDNNVTKIQTIKYSPNFVTNVNNLLPLVSTFPGDSSKEINRCLQFLKADDTMSIFLDSPTIIKLEYILKDIDSYNRIKKYSRSSHRYTNLKKYYMKTKKYSEFILEVMQNCRHRVKPQLLSVLMFLRKSIFLTRSTNKKVNWLRHQLNRLKKTKLDPFTTSRFIFKKKKKHYFKLLYRLWRKKKKAAQQKAGSRHLINKIVKQSFKQKLNISKSQDYSFFYLLFLEKNSLLSLFRNFLIKNGLKKKANNWLLNILITIKGTYKICPVRTLRFLILQHFKASLIRELKLKKKTIYIPKRLSVKKQLFYMVHSFFKEVDQFNSVYNQRGQFSYKLLGTHKDRVSYCLSNYICSLMDYGITNTYLSNKNLLLEEKLYTLKHFIKPPVPRRHNTFKYTKRYSAYKGHPYPNI